MSERAELVAVEVRFRSFRLGPVSAVLPDGCTTLLGTNGAGKSTLMRAMLGLEPKASGHLLLGAARSDRHASRGAFRAAVGWVPQSPEFPRFVSVAQCIAYAADLKGIPRAAAAGAVERAAHGTNLLELLKRPASTLSGGQQKRLAIAQATVHEPTLLVMDEPTAGLDPVQRLEFRAWLSEYAARHRVVISTHLVEDVEESSGQVIVLHEGSLVFTGSTQQLLARVDGAGGDSLERAVALFLRGFSS